MTTVTADTINKDDFRRHESDCGSPEVQIATLTARILGINRSPQNTQARSPLSKRFDHARW